MRTLTGTLIGTLPETPKGDDICYLIGACTCMYADIDAHKPAAYKHHKSLFSAKG